MARNVKPLLRRTIGKSEPSHLALTEVFQARPTARAYCLSGDLLFLHLGMISLRAAGGFVHRPNQTRLLGILRGLCLRALVSAASLGALGCAVAGLAVGILWFLAWAPAAKHEHTCAERPNFSFLASDLRETRGWRFGNILLRNIDAARL